MVDGGMVGKTEKMGRKMVRTVEKMERMDGTAERTVKNQK
jgi:hypothetical protein